MTLWVDFILQYMKTLTCTLNIFWLLSAVILLIATTKYSWRETKSNEFTFKIVVLMHSAL